VVDGTEQAMTASVDRLRLERAMAPYLVAWKRYAYQEAAAGLERIRVAANAPDRQSLNRSEAGARPPVDLWLNAQRRASQGRFDDAVARIYRLIEWTAQWLIRTKLKADTGDFPEHLLPEDARPNGQGRIKLPLWAAWQVVRSHMQGPAHDLIASHGKELRDLLSIRNDSILAHGFAPVPQASWDRMQQWAQDRFLPVLHHYAKETGVKKPLQQLPTDPPEPTAIPRA
jgi:CRISPR-associated protein (TIGR02710 family)